MLFPSAKSAISLSSSDSHVWVVHYAVFILEPAGIGAREQDYGLSPCNPLFPSTFSLSCYTRGPETGLVDASVLAFWAVSFISMRFRPSFQILFRRLRRCSQTFLCWLHVFTLMLVLIHSCIAKGQNFVDFFTTKPVQVTWNYYVSERYIDCIVLIFVG